MADDPKFGAFWSVMNDEFERTREWVLKISGQPELLSNNPGIKASIGLRENIVLSLLVIRICTITLREEEVNEQERAVLKSWLFAPIWEHQRFSKQCLRRKKY